MEACSQDIIRAIASKDAKHLAQALSAAFECYMSSNKDSEDNSYDAQNAKAAEGNE